MVLRIESTMRAGLAASAKMRTAASVLSGVTISMPTSACSLNGGSHELNGNTSERAEIGVQRIALFGKHHARERARQHQMAGLERDSVASQLVCKPRNPERRVAEHPGGDAGLLDLGILVHDAADPAQVEVERTDRPA